MYNSLQRQLKKMPLVSRFIQIIFFLIFVSATYLVLSFEPLTKEQQMEDFHKMQESIEPFRKNLSECARQVQASDYDVQNFLKNVPQVSMPGKCLVACILRRIEIIKNNKINPNNLLEANRPMFGSDKEVWAKLQKAVKECIAKVEKIFEICEYASTFNDCMHMKMEHVFDEDMNQRMEALEQMSGETDHLTDDADNLLKMMRDEL